MHICCREAKNSLFPPDPLFMVSIPKNRTYVLGERDPGSPRIGERQATEMIEADNSFQTFTSASSTQYINKYNTVEH